MDEHRHSLVLPFDTTGTDFVRGVEVGRIWEQLKSDAAVVETVHATNAEMMLRMSEATGRALTGEILDDTWMIVEFDPAA